MARNSERCAWCGSDPLYVAYHDKEWGVPLHDDNALFEFLVLEGFQAGLSWITILRKRDNFRRAFDNFDPLKVVRYSEKRFEKLMQDSGIIRNRMKIEASVANARAFLKVQEEFGSFDAYNWGFVDGRPLVNQWQEMGEIPAQTELAVKFSKDLKARDFKFVGPTIVYAHMQATGMVNDHVTGCFRHAQLRKLK
ncbi:MAG: DNA-3-methyladenine glycosylase I [Planctomycetales bacterium]|nr:DNA-3-methyladenine glycosylase I [bacterium]UNM08258.1 MAG: DNA-3-methyladenine glycosylase I [Planctomycetales bacterium]